MKKDIDTGAKTNDTDLGKSLDIDLGKIHDDTWGKTKEGQEGFMEEDDCK